jgi:hypothetical protein
MIKWSLGVDEFVKTIMWEGETWNCAYKKEDVCKCSYH